MFTYTQAIDALETILAQVENDGEMFDEPVADSTIEAVREALYALQAEEANQERFENREGDPAFNGAFNRW